MSSSAALWGPHSPLHNNRADEVQMGSFPQCRASISDKWHPFFNHNWSKSSLCGTHPTSIICTICQGVYLFHSSRFFGAIPFGQVADEEREEKRSDRQAEDDQNWRQRVRRWEEGNEKEQKHRAWQSKSNTVDWQSRFMTKPSVSMWRAPLLIRIWHFRTKAALCRDWCEVHPTSAVKRTRPSQRHASKLT